MAGKSGVKALLALLILLGVLAGCQSTSTGPNPPPPSAPPTSAPCWADGPAGCGI